VKVLVVGVGNPGRRDDGLGGALVDRINVEKKGGQAPISREIGACPLSIKAEWKCQLNIEDAQAVQDADLVVFADATTEGEEPATLEEIAPAAQIAVTTHAMAPASVLALAEELYGRAPKAYLLAIRGYDFDIGETLSPQAAANLESALSLFSEFLLSLK